MAPPTRAPRPIRTVIAEQVTTIRKNRGWTQQELADRLSEVGCADFGRGVIAKIETQKRGVTAEELLALSAALNVSPVNLCVPYNPDEQVEITPEIRVPAQSARRWFYAWEPIVSGKGKDQEFFSEFPPDEW